MCISCGCKRYEISHDDERNITVDTLQRAADASNKTLAEVVGAMAAGCSDMQSRGIPHHDNPGQAVKERLHEK